MNTVEGMQNIFSIVPSHFIQMFAFIFTYSHISDFSFVPFERQSSAYNMSQYIRSLQAVFFFFFLLHICYKCNGSSQDLHITGRFYTETSLLSDVRYESNFCEKNNNRLHICLFPSRDFSLDAN